MTRRAQMMILLSFLLALLGSGFAVAQEQTREDTSRAVVQPPDLSARELIWQAILRALKERGLTVSAASPEEGRVTTEFAPLAVSTIAQVTLPNDPPQAVPWGGGEYRYEVNIGSLSDRLRISAKTEIRAWKQGEQNAAPGTDTKQVVQSNHTLEQEFLKAFQKALGQGQ